MTAPRLSPLHRFLTAPCSSAPPTPVVTLSLAISRCNEWMRQPRSGVGLARMLKGNEQPSPEGQRPISRNASIRGRAIFDSPPPQTAGKQPKPWQQPIPANVRRALGITDGLHQYRHALRIARTATHFDQYLTDVPQGTGIANGIADEPISHKVHCRVKHAGWSSHITREGHPRCFEISGQSTLRQHPW